MRKAAFVKYNVYILTNRKRGTFYIGVTSDLEGRISEHKLKLHEGFTKKHNIDCLVYYESFENIIDAIAREKQLKRYKREWKCNLIEQDNPHWQDLAELWFDYTAINQQAGKRIPAQGRDDSFIVEKRV